jgi:hypothetical protein
MSALRFGMVQATDIQPGFAFKNPKNARNIYMVTERVDKPVHHPGLSKQDKGWTEVRFKADRYEGQMGGFYLKKAECQTPVVFNANGENPAYDPVAVERKRGDKLWIQA